MTEFAEGGYVGGGESIPPAWLDNGYVIPREFADRWKELLDKINEGVYGVEVADTTSPGKEGLGLVEES